MPYDPDSRIPLRPCIQTTLVHEPPIGLDRRRAPVQAVGLVVSEAAQTDSVISPENEIRIEHAEFLQVREALDSIELFAEPMWRNGDRCVADLAEQRGGRGEEERIGVRVCDGAQVRTQ